MRQTRLFCVVQVSLFNNIKALFVNKPLVLVANKTDIKKIEDLPPAKKRYFEEFQEQHIPIIQMSTLNEEGVMAVRNEVRTCLVISRTVAAEANLYVV